MLGTLINKVPAEVREAHKVFEFEQGFSHLSSRFFLKL
jgi:hypothetical protein